MGIEPISSAWKADILPLNYICMAAVNGFEPMITGSKPVAFPLG